MPNDRSYTEQWLRGFLGSGLNAGSFGLIGIDPPNETRDWEMEHPNAALFAGLLGAAVPYTGWFKVARGIRPLERFAAGLEASTAHPILGRAAGAAVRLAPFEAGRVAGSATLAGPLAEEMNRSTQPTSDVIVGGLVNTALAGAIGGGVGLFREAGRRAPKINRIFPGIDTTQPMPLILRDAEGMLQSVPAEQQSRAMNFISQLRESARADEAPAARYVAPLEGVEDKQASRLNRLFNSQADKGRDPQQTRRLIVTEMEPGSRYQKDFYDEASWRATANRVPMPESFESRGQYYRHLSFAPTRNGERMAKATQNIIDNTLAEVGDNWYMRREKGDGLWVMAKKMSGAPGKFHASDEWMLLKTDQPEAFAQKVVKSGDALTDRIKLLQAYTPEDLQIDGGQFYNQVKQFENKFPYQDYMTYFGGTGKKAEMLDRIALKLGLKDREGTTNEAVQRVADMMNRTFAPTMYQFKKSPLAQYAVGMTRMIQDAADAMKDQIIFGKISLKPGQSLIGQILGTGKSMATMDGTGSKIYRAPESVAKDLWPIWRLMQNEADMELNYSFNRMQEGSRNVGREMFAANRMLNEELNKVATATGKTRGIPYGDETLGIERVMEGEVITPLRNREGKVMHIAAGDTAKQSQDKALQVHRAHPDWIMDNTFGLGDRDRIPRDILSIITDPGFFKERGDIGGFKHSNAPWTKKEMLDLWRKSVSDRLDEISKMASEAITQKYLSRLAIEDPYMYKTATERINDIHGVPRETSVRINRFVDGMLGQYLGKNSATRIAHTMNKLQYHFQLGGLGNVGNIIMQAVAPIQTVLPEISYVLNGVPERLAGYYSYFAAGGSKGQMAPMAILEPVRIMRKAWSEMRNPSENLREAMEWAANNRVFDQRLHEDYFEQGAVKLTDMRKAAKEGQFVDWMESLSNFLPGNAERFSRAYSFTVGNMIARDFFNLAGEEAWNFARQFTNKTMYLYGAADRPSMFLGPAGGMFGLFKNWSMHYFYGMMDYAGAGLTENNWAPLIWQQLGTWTIGGLAASPLYNAANVMSEMYNDKTIMENVYNAFGPDAADGVFYGLPVLLSGAIPFIPRFGLTSQASGPGTNPGRDANQLMSFVGADRIANMGKAIGTAVDEWYYTGNNPAASQEFRDYMIKAFMPRTLQKVAQAFTDEGIRSLGTGHPIVKDATPIEKGLFAMGLNPTQLDRMYQVSSIMWREKAAHDAELERLAKAFNEAKERQDYDGMNMIIKKATLDGIGANAVWRSASKRWVADNEDIVERNFGADALLRFKAVLPQY